MQEIWVQSLGREDPLAKGMETHSSILAWESPWTEEEPDGLQSIGSQRVGHDLVTKQLQDNSQDYLCNHYSVCSIQAKYSLFDQLIQRTDDCSFVTRIRRFLSACYFGGGIFFSSLAFYLMYSS